MENNLIRNIAGIDTPWHIGYAKKEEDDPRRDKRRCIFLEKGRCTNGQSGAFAMRCPGSSHCGQYREEYREDEYIKEERCDFETVLFREFSRQQVWDTYRNSDQCPFCGWSQITKTEDRLSCPRCELILRKPIEERMQETASGIIVRVPGDPYSKPTWIPRAKETGIVTTKDIKQTHHKNRPLIALPGDSTCLLQGRRYLQAQQADLSLCQKRNMYVLQ